MKQKMWTIIYHHQGLNEKFSYMFLFFKEIIFVFIYHYSGEDEKPAFSFDIDQELAGLRKKQSQVNSRIMNKGLGDWEKHTKGIGAKLLLGVI